MKIVLGCALCLDDGHRYLDLSLFAMLVVVVFLRDHGNGGIGGLDTGCCGSWYESPQRGCQIGRNGAVVDEQSQRR